MLMQLFGVLLLVMRCNSNMISFFDSGCPQGWEIYEAALDRTLIAAGKTYANGTIGGQKQHSQTYQEMAVHNHKNKVHESAYNSYTAKNTYPTGLTYANSANRALRSNTYNYQNSNQISNAGAGKPFSLMQPYLALSCCRKKTDTLTDTQITAQTTENKIGLALSIFGGAFGLIAFIVSLVMCCQKENKISVQNDSAERQPNRKFSCSLKISYFQNRCGRLLVLFIFAVLPPLLNFYYVFSVFTLENYNNVKNLNDQIQIKTFGEILIQFYSKQYFYSLIIVAGGVSGILILISFFNRCFYHAKKCKYYFHVAITQYLKYAMGFPAALYQYKFSQDGTGSSFEVTYTLLCLTMFIEVGSKLLENCLEFSEQKTEIILPDISPIIVNEHSQVES